MWGNCPVQVLQHLLTPIEGQQELCGWPVTAVHSTASGCYLVNSVSHLDVSLDA